MRRKIGLFAAFGQVSASCLLILVETGIVKLGSTLVLSAVIVVFVAGVALVAEEFTGTLHQWQERNVEQLESHARSLFRSIHQECSIPADHIITGVHFRRRTWRHPVSGELRRLALVAVVNPPYDPIRYTKGKGIAGTAWKEGQTASFGLRKYIEDAEKNAKNTTRGTFAEAWNASPPENRLGLNANEARCYPNVAWSVAAPIGIRKKGGPAAFAGVLTADLLPGEWKILKSTSKDLAYVSKAAQQLADGIVPNK